ncbi:MAG TPA: hypothetical protein VF472_07420 [Burkholderiaceae bacterium]
MSVLPPASQKAGDRPISFVLTDLTVSPALGRTFDMVIRPEELTRTDVTRATVQQTLGGAWADDFGPGLATINISGHTGWRGSQFGNSDGMDQFAQLKNQVFTEWHSRRNAAVKAGLDPGKVSLAFADALDSTIDLVIPMNFTLRRSRSRPLLMQFNIAMVAYRGKVFNPSSSSSSGIGSALSALTSMLKSIANIVSAVAGAIKFVQSSIVGPVVAFMNSTKAVFSAVTNLIGNAESIPLTLLNTAKSMAQAGNAMFATIAAVPANTADQMAAAMIVAAEYSNILCLLMNAVNRQILYPDYTPLYGASNCSSTAGGSPESPYADTNPFYAVMGAPQNAPAPVVTPATAPAISASSSPAPVVSVSPQAQQALVQINSADPVLAPIGHAALGLLAGHIATGIVLK